MCCCDKRDSIIECGASTVAISGRFIDKNDLGTLFDKAVNVRIGEDEDEDDDEDNEVADPFAV
jgi:hypothetical protein